MSVTFYPFPNRFQYFQKFLKRQAYHMQKVLKKSTLHQNEWQGAMF